MTETVTTPKIRVHLPTLARRTVKVAIIGALATAAVVAVKRFQETEDVTAS